MALLFGSVISFYYLYHMKHKHINPFLGKHSIQDLASCMWNYWYPIASKVMDDIDYRITDGFIDWVAKKKSVILYKDGHIVGVFNTVDEAKDFVKNNHKKFCNIKNNLYLYNLNPYNQN